MQTKRNCTMLPADRLAAASVRMRAKGRRAQANRLLLLAWTAYDVQEQLAVISLSAKRNRHK